MRTSAAGQPSRVVLIGLDGFPHRHVTPGLTPRLWRLGLEGGRAPDGGRSELPSTTYPGFVTLLTGSTPERHGVRTTFDKEGAVPGWAGQRMCGSETLIDACRRSSVEARVIMGDHLLYSVFGLATRDEAWPSGGRLADDVPRDAHGYPTNEAVWRHQVEALEQPDVRFAFCHLNEADTIGHDHGPESDEALDCCGRTDGIVSRLLDALAPSWQRAIVIVVSDHDMEPSTRAQGIDPMALPGVPAIASDWIGDGGCAWLRLHPDVDRAEVDAVLAAQEAIVAWRRVGERLLILAAPGEAFHAGPVPLKGIHGGFGTVRTVAIVGGGHPAVPALARAIAERPPRLRDWAPTIAGLLDLRLEEADGVDLLA